MTKHVHIKINYYTKVIALKPELLFWDDIRVRVCDCVLFRLLRLRL